VTQAGSKIDSCKFYFCKKSENCQLFPPHMLALPHSPTNNAGIATAPLSYYTVEDRGDIMAKGRKIQILGCLSCLLYLLYREAKGRFYPCFSGNYLKNI
jgi:hypothetical protein